MHCFTLQSHAKLSTKITYRAVSTCDRRLVAATGLKENVAALPPIDSIAAITLQPINHTIANAPGKKASVAIYSHLATKYGGKLTVVAAEEGLQLYDEVVADAKAHPGSHPNIDILLNVISSKKQHNIEVTHQ